VSIQQIRALATRNRHQFVEAGRFVVAGFLNTGITYAIYLILLVWFGYELSYALSYAAGIVISYLANAIFVFRRPIKMRSAMAFPLVYAAQFLIGFLLMKLLVDWLMMPVEIAPLMTVAVTLPLTYLLSRKIITGRIFQRKENSGR
jgi:putative flippase GtrA